MNCCDAVVLLQLIPFELILMVHWMNNGLKYIQIELTTNAVYANDLTAASFDISFSNLKVSLA